MDDGFLAVRRLSRILYRGKFFHYPLKPFEALCQLGLFESAWVAAQLPAQEALPAPPEDTLESWMSNRFGRRLFLMFFKTYTEKVWGIPCTEIRAEWAAQRIKTLTLWGAAQERPLARARTEHAQPDRGVRLSREGSRHALGADGAQARGRGSRSCTSSASVVGVRWSGRARRRRGRPAAADREEEHRGSDFIASMPLPELVLALDPPAPPEVQAHARALRYRDFITVALVIRKREALPRQLDLHPHARGARRPHPELQELERRAWCPTPRRPASASSTSAPRATSSGRSPTRSSWPWPAARP